MTTTTTTTRRIECAYCEKEATQGGVENKFCEFHWGFFVGATTILEFRDGVHWQQAQDAAKTLLTDPYCSSNLTTKRRNIARGGDAVVK